MNCFPKFVAQDIERIDILPTCVHLKNGLRWKLEWVPTDEPLSAERQTANLLLLQHEARMDSAAQSTPTQPAIKIPSMADLAPCFCGWYHDGLPNKDALTSWRAPDGGSSTSALMALGSSCFPAFTKP